MPRQVTRTRLRPQRSAAQGPVLRLYTLLLASREVFCSRIVYLATYAAMKSFIALLRFSRGQDLSSLWAEPELKWGQPLLPFLQLSPQYVAVNPT